REALMAYVPGFKHDIFISYARENNVPDLDNIQWVTDFFTNLKRSLQEWIDPDIYFDTRDFEAGHDIDDLLDHARTSALLLVVLSPRYAQPPEKFTLKELKAFCGEKPPHNRIIVVELIPTPKEIRPQELQGPKRIQFYRTDDATNALEKLTRLFNREIYLRRFNQIVVQIKNRLDEMRTDAPTDTIATSSGRAPKTVLLAKCTDDLVDEPNEVRSYLEQFGVRVLPDGDYPEWGTDFVSRYTTDLARADLVVQLLSSVRSARNGEGPSCAKFQYDAAKAAGRQVLQWQHPEIEKKLAKVQHYDVSFLRTAPDICRMGLEQFK